MTAEIKPMKKEPKAYNAHQRAQAVLSIWTQRRKPAEVCRQIGINTTMLGQWEQRAMAGMINALQPRCRCEQQLGPALSEKLERLLARQTLVADGKMAKLEKRLAKMSVEPPSNPSPSKEK